MTAKDILENYQAKTVYQQIKKLSPDDLDLLSEQVLDYISTLDTCTDQHLENLHDFLENNLEQVEYFNFMRKLAEKSDIFLIRYLKKYPEESRQMITWFKSLEDKSKFEKKFRKKKIK